MLVSLNIKKVTPSGVVTTIVGDGSGGFLDGVGTSAKISSVYALTLLDDNTLIFYDGSYRLRAVELNNNNTVSTIIGTGNSGNTDGDFDTASIAPVYGMHTSGNNVFFSNIIQHSIRVAAFGSGEGLK